MKNVSKWKDYYNEKEPHKAEIPEPWQSKLNDFQKMIVLRTIRPDKVREKKRERERERERREGGD